MIDKMKLLEKSWEDFTEEEKAFLTSNRNQFCGLCKHFTPMTGLKVTVRTRKEAGYPLNPDDPVVSCTKGTCDSCKYPNTMQDEKGRFVMFADEADEYDLCFEPKESGEE